MRVSWWDISYLRIPVKTLSSMIGPLGRLLQTLEWACIHAQMQAIFRLSTVIRWVIPRLHSICLLVADYKSRLLILGDTTYYFLHLLFISKICKSMKYCRSFLRASVITEMKHVMYRECFLIGIAQLITEHSVWCVVVDFVFCRWVWCNRVKYEAGSLETQSWRDWISFNTWSRCLWCCYGMWSGCVLFQTWRRGDTTNFFSPKMYS